MPKGKGYKKKRSVPNKGKKPATKKGRKKPHAKKRKC